MSNWNQGKNKRINSCNVVQRTIIIMYWLLCLCFCFCIFNISILTNIDDTSWLSFCADFFCSVRILRNFKSPLYPKKCCYQVTRMILALMRIVLCIKIMFKRVKLQFTWKINIECWFCWNKNDKHVIHDKSVEKKIRFGKLIQILSFHFCTNIDQAMLIMIFMFWINLIIFMWNTTHTWTDAR